MFRYSDSTVTDRFLVWYAVQSICAQGKLGNTECTLINLHNIKAFRLHALCLSTVGIPSERLLTITLPIALLEFVGMSPE